MQTKLFSWVNDLALERKALLLIVLVFAVQAAVIFSYGAIVDRCDSLNFQEHHDKELIGRVNWLSTLVVTASVASLAHAVTGDEEYGQLLARGRQAVNAEIALMAQVVADDRVERENLDAIKEEWRKLEMVLAADTAASPRDWQKSLASPEMKTLWRRLFLARRAILGEEATRFPICKADFSGNRHMLQSSLNVVVLLDFLIAVAVFYMFSLQIVQRIKTVADNSQRLATGAPLNQPLPGRDEIQQLDSRFHQMAGQLIAARNELEFSEKRVRAILSHVPTGVLVVQADLTIEFANGQAESLFDCSAEALEGMSVIDLFQADRNQTALAQSLSGQHETSLELTAKRPDASTFRAEISINVMAFLDSEKILLAVKDVSERHELERMKREFVSMVCHDLRNPLSSLQLFHDMLAGGYLGELTGSGPKLLANAQRCTENLLTLTNDMLELDRLDFSGGDAVDLVRSPAQLDTIIEQAIASAEGIARPKEIEINYSGSAVALDCDQSKIFRVISNLLGNAAKFSPEKSAITINVVEKDGRAKISVTDQGRGIPQSMHEAVFDKFKQVSLKDSGRGSGLGLAICKKFVESHNGAIGVISEPGQGSTFWFTLPVLPSPKSAIVESAFVAAARE